MEVIRDEELGGIMMIPLLNQWHIHRCNVRDCRNKPTTIITGVIENAFGLCEEHYSESKREGKLAYTLDFFELENASQNSA